MYLYVLVLGFSVQHEGACAKAFNGWLTVTALWQTPSGTTDLKKASCGGPATALQTVLVSSKAKIGKCFTCLSPVWIAPVSSFLGLLPLISAGDTGTNLHSMQGRMDTCSPGGERDNVVKSGTGSCHGLSFWPSCHSVDWKSKHKLISAVSTVDIALKVDSSAIWHQIGMFTINLWSNTSIYVLIQTNTNQYIPIHTTILATIWASRLESTRIVFEYMPNTYLIHANTYQNTCQYLYAGRKPVCWTEIEYMPLHAKYMPIHTNTYHDTCQIHTNTRLVQHSGFCPAYKYHGMYWFVLCKYLVCTM